MSICMRFADCINVILEKKISNKKYVLYSNNGTGTYYSWHGKNIEYMIVIAMMMLKECHGFSGFY